MNNLNNTNNMNNNKNELVLIGKHIYNRGEKCPVYFVGLRTARISEQLDAGIGC